MAELPQNITQARESAQSLAAGAGQMGAESFKVGDILKQKALDAYKNNQDIIKPLDEATTDYVQAPSEARAKYVDPQSENYIFNPFQAENLVSQYTSQQALPMMLLSSIMGQRFGRIDDTIGAGTRAFQAQAAAQQAKATNAQNLYTNLLNEYQLTQEDPTKYETFSVGDGTAIWDPYTGEIVNTISDIDQINGKNKWGEPTEPDEPVAVNPTETKPRKPDLWNNEWFSQEGEWYWDPASQEWYPVY